MKTFWIAHYGTGNIGSLIMVFQKMGYFVGIAHSAEQLLRADLVILPGVGAAGTAMDSLHFNGMAKALSKRHEAGLPILGICLGAQLMFEYLHECGRNGFGWITGEVTPLTEYPFYNNGWCQLDHEELRHSGLARGLKPNSTFFFNHRYVLGNDLNKKSVSVLGRPGIPAIYLDRNICAIQFHPEKSQHDGKIILRNVLEDYYGF
jgi:imidazole glycerol-phosphate synthase subunit HisH